MENEKEPNLDELMPTVDVKSRRKFLKQGLMLGLSGTALATFLAACGASATNTPAAPQPTPTTASLGTIAVAATTAAAPATTAAASTATTAAAPATTAAASTAKKGGTITVVGHQEVPTLNPDKAAGDVPTVIIYQMFNSLYETDENYVLQPYLATAYEVSDGGKTYTFKLRQGVKWHDGEAFDAEDVKYTFEYYANPDNKAANINNFRDVASVETPDKYTAIIKLKNPSAPFMVRTATASIVPEHYHKKVGIDEFSKKPIGTGPFKLKEWKPAEYTLLDANKDYFLGAPNVDAFRQDIVPEASVRAIAVDTGKADAWTWSPLVEDMIKFSKDTARFTVFKTTSLPVNHFILNNQKGPLVDKNFRKALMLATPRQRFVDDIFKGLGAVATANLNPALKAWYEPNVTKYDYSPDKAKALLEENGWKAGADGIRVKDGVKATFTMTTITGDTARRPEAELAQQEWKAIGVDLQLKESPLTPIQTELVKGKDGSVDASLFNWTYGDIEPDAFATLRSDGPQNWNSYKNPKMDELLDKGRVETDAEKRKAIYSEVQKIVSDEIPMLYIYFPEAISVYNKRIKGLPPTALASLNLYRSTHKWSIDEAK
jgi:peptide/nickel transport system substrate-binding protein